MPVIVAHRGLHDAHPENSLAALQAAWAAGVAWCECDVQLTGDRRTVLLHDDTLDRTATGTGPVATRLYSDLRPLRLRLADGSPTAEPIPLLPDVLAAMPAECGLLVELKPPMTAFHHVAKVYLQRGLRVIFQSFDIDTVRSLCHAGLAKHTAMLLDQPGFVNLALEMGVGGVHLRHDLAEPIVVHRLKSANVRVGAWTVDDPDQARGLVSIGVEWLITDRPTRLRQALGQSS